MDIYKLDKESYFKSALIADISGEYEKAFKLFEKAAQQNIAEAQFECGYRCLIGLGTKKDVANAYKLICRAANQNNCEAQYILSQMYFFGIWVNKDKVKSSKWLEKAKQHGEDLSKLISLELWDGYGED